jgi:branched-chain amino acid transport system substrate-binding protein
MKRALITIVLGAFVLLSFLSGPATAAGTKYTIPVIADFSGAYAELFKAWVPMHKAVFPWWNDTVGKGLGVELEVKHYDGRYDQAVITGMWPGILADCKPIIALGGGGADVAALQQRLPQDKVAVIYGTAAYGYGWLPDQWLFQVRPLYTQEWLAALVWYINNHPEKRPVKLGIMSAQITAALDIVKGLEKYFREVLEPQGLGKIVATEFVDINPVDVSPQMKKIIDAKADIVVGPVTTAMATAYTRACQMYGVNIPTIASPHHTIYPFARAMKTYEPFEGHMVTAAHVSVTETNSPAHKFFTLLKEKYGLQDPDLNPFNIMSLSQSILAVRAVEHAVKKVGPANLTGQAVYDAMFAEPFTEQELMGVLPDLYFTKDAPFSNKNLKVKIDTVKGGKYVIATPDWVPIPPDVKKW